MRNFWTYILIIVISISVAFNLYPATVLAASEDQPSSWAFQQIDILKTLKFGDESIYNNYRQNITREEFSMLVVSLYEMVTRNSVEAGGINPFSDISESPWKTEIIKAHSLKIVKGVGNGLFNPSGKITRQEVAVMIYNTIRAIHPEEELTINTDLAFHDEAQIQSWAKPAVAFLYDNFIMRGIDELTIGPTLFTTREQALLLLFKTGILSGFLDIDALKARQISKDDDGSVEAVGTVNAEEYWKLGRTFVQEGNNINKPLKAITAYDRAIELDPAFYRAYRDKAEALALLGRYEEAMKNAEKALELNDSDGWCYVRRGRIYSALDNKDKSIQDFTKALDLLTENEPDNRELGSVYIYRAQDFLKKVMIKEAIADLKAAAKYELIYWQILYLLGV